MTFGYWNLGLGWVQVSGFRVQGLDLDDVRGVVGRGSGEGRAWLRLRV